MYLRRTACKQCCVLRVGIGKFHIRLCSEVKRWCKKHFAHDRPLNLGVDGANITEVRAAHFPVITAFPRGGGLAGAAQPQVDLESTRREDADRCRGGALHR